MFNPKSARARVGVSQRESVNGPGVGEERGIEVQPESLITGPVLPACEVLRLQIVPFDSLPSGLGVDRVKVEPMAARDKGKRPFGIHAEFNRRPCPPGMVASDGETSPDLLAGSLEASNIVALPAMEREWNRGKRLER